MAMPSAKNMQLSKLQLYRPCPRGVWSSCGERTSGTSPRSAGRAVMRSLLSLSLSLSRRGYIFPRVLSCSVSSSPSPYSLVASDISWSFLFGFLSSFAFDSFAFCFYFLLTTV